MDYYEILGVPKEATTQEIKKAFRQIARECHPDVTGDDPTAAEKFKEARKAYETLIDPVTRSRYDRRGQRRSFAKGSFFDAFYRHTAGAAEGTPEPAGPRKAARPPNVGAHDAGGTPGPDRKQKKNPANDLDLDDLFNNFGDFGFGGAKAKSTGSPGSSRAPESAPEPGDDVRIVLEVDAGIARDGGTVTAQYSRLQRSDRYSGGGGGGSLARVNDIADIRIIPGTLDGEVLTERGLGDAGLHGGSYGDLIVRVRLVGRAPAPPPVPDPPPVSDGQEESVVVDISVVEALLGGRVEVDTPRGRVRLTLPPGTSSGTRLRLKGKGNAGADLFVETRIVVPRVLDDESRRLIEEFARLNPGTPREG